MGHLRAVTLLTFLVASTLSADTGLISTVAGGGAGGVGGPATSASISVPEGVALDAAGNLYIADRGYGRVVRVDAVTGILTLVAGNGGFQASGDGGPATLASFAYVQGLALDAAGNLFISDRGDHRIRRVDAQTGIITTFAGTGTPSSTGDGGPATAATLWMPEGLAFDHAGNLYVVENSGARVRRVDAATGIITTVAGNGSAGFSGDGGPAVNASLLNPTAIAFDHSDNLYISDSGNCRIRRVDAATALITTIAGNGARLFGGDGVAATVTGLGYVVALAFDSGNNLFIAGYTAGRIMRIDALTGVLSTVAGNGFAGVSAGDGGPATSATLNGAQWLAVTSNDNLVISEYAGNRVRRIFLPSPLLYSATNLSSSVNGSAVTITATVAPIAAGGIPTGSVQFFGAPSESSSGGGSGSGGYSIPSLGSATLVNGTASLVTSALTPGSYGVVALYSGDGAFNASAAPILLLTVTSAAPVGTSVALASTANPTIPNANVQFNAQVTATGDGGGHSPTGYVDLLDGGIVVASGQIFFNSAIINVAFTTLGDHSLTAHYRGDSIFAASTSTAITETVKSLPTVALVSDANPASVGATVNFTATIAQTTATGTIDLRETPPSGISVTLATAPVVNSRAVFAISNLAPGTHNILARYNGDVSFVGAGSSYLNQFIGQIGTVVTLTSTQNPTTPNIGIPYIVQVAAAAPTSLLPSGSVQLMDGVTLLATASLVNGSVQIPLSFPATGTHSLTAVYAGDTNFSGSTSAVVTEEVKLMSTGTLTSTPNPAIAGSPVTLTARVFQTTATGTVDFLDYSAPGGPLTLGSAPLVNSVATFATSALSAGTHSVQANYSGDANFVGFGTSLLSQIVKVATTTSLTANPNTPGYGQQVQFTANVTPASATGTLQFLDGATSLGTVTVSSGTAVLAGISLPAGAHTVTAVYSGDSNNGGSTSPAWSQNVAKADTTVTAATSGTPAMSGSPVTFSATLSPAAATGSVQFLDGAASLGTVAVSSGAASLATSALAVGNHSITAVYSGDVNYNASTSTAVAQLVKGTTTLAVTSNGASSAYGQAVQFTATATPGAATGGVQFLDGGVAIGTANLSGGIATLTAPALAVGTHTITASYGGDSLYTASTSAAWSQTVGKAATNMAVGTSANPVMAGTPVTFSASVSPTSATGSVQFLDGATSLGTVAVSGGAASLNTSTLSVGNRSITAVYSGDGNYNTSTSAVLSQLVKGATTLSMSSNGASSVYGQPVLFTAAATPGAATGSVQFLDGGLPLGTANLTGGAATLSVSSLAAGTHAITAVYGGDSLYNGSTSSAWTQTVSKAATGVTVGSSANPSVSGNSVTFTAGVSPAAATGSVQFKDGGAVLATIALTAGTASWSTAALSVGTHSITAVYSGDANYSASTSGTLTQTVNAALPGAPSNLIATSASNSQISLVWSASPTSGVTYNVYSATTSGFTPSTANRIATGLTSTTYIHSGLAATTTHYYLVTAQNSVGISAPSNQADATTLSGGKACHVVYTVTTDWNTGFGTAITIKNTGTSAINGWTLTWTWSGNQQITQSWNSSYTQTGANAKLTNAAWNAAIAPGATLSGMGFNANYSGANTAPTAFYLNGKLCQ